MTHWLALLVAVGLLAAACGDDDDAASAGDDTTLTDPPDKCETSTVSITD